MNDIVTLDTFLEQVASKAAKFSESLAYVLGRNYLSEMNNDSIRLSSPERSAPKPSELYFLRLEQVGSSKKDDLNDPFLALQTAFSGCHVPDGPPQLIFIANSDGNRNNVYLGLKPRNYKHSARSFLENLGNSLEGNWPGTLLKPCSAADPRFTQQVSLATSRARYVTALTGIPSFKTGESRGYPQSLDRLLRGCRGMPFTYMVLAQPMVPRSVTGIIEECRKLEEWVHLFGKITLNETLARGVSQSDTVSVSQGQSRTDSIASFNDALALLLSRFPPMALFSIFADRSSRTQSVGSGFSQSLGLTLSRAAALGQEYVDTHARASETQLQHYIDRYEKARVSGCWNVGIYVLSEEPEIAQRVATQLRSLLSGERSRFEPIRLHDLEDGVLEFLRAFEQPTLELTGSGTATALAHPLGAAFDSLTTPLNTEELAFLVNLPRREVAGVSVKRVADFSLNPPTLDAQQKRARLGDVLEAGRIPLRRKAGTLCYDVALRSLAKHVLVAGSTGSGKTTTSKLLLDEIHHHHKIPFLVIEPTKDEYVSWAMEKNRAASAEESRIAVYVPGAGDWRGAALRDTLRLNPLDFVHLPPARPRVVTHMDHLKSVLNAAFPMQESLPFLLEDLLYRAYGGEKEDGENWLKWSGSVETKPGSPKPSLRSLDEQSVSGVVKSKGYEGWPLQNLTAALNTRLESLRQGFKQELFNQEESTDWQELFDKPAVVNLKYVGDNVDRALVMSLLLLFLYEYRQASMEATAGSADGGLAHLTVVEEAHRILRPAAAERMDLASPQAKVSEMFADVLGEIRYYGEGIMIVDQSPNRLIPDVVKNTNLKVVHRLVSRDDSEAMAHAMGLSRDQAAVLNQLRPGQAIVFGDLDDKPCWLKIRQPAKAEERKET